MADHADVSGPMTLPRRPRNPAQSFASGAITAPASAAAGILPRHPAPPAEIAQARVFERLLQSEHAELSELAHRVAAEGNQQPGLASGELTQLRARIAEIDGLLGALQGRFPHSNAK